MNANYFGRIREQTQTRLWINNPTVPEIQLSIAHGAVACTTNPTFGANMLRRDRDYALGVVDQCLGESDNDSVVADLVQQRLATRVLEGFRPVYEQTRGTLGFVSIQGDPYGDTNAEHIIHEARRYTLLAPNFIAKIPVTAAGLEAMGVLLAEGMPVIATEIFALAQMVESCELYRRVCAKSGVEPAFFVTHITGIFDEYLKRELVDTLRIKVAPGMLAQAGLALARKQYRLFKERGYGGYLLGGGARGPQHFTGLVGGEWHITINWSTAEEILALDPPVENTVAIETAGEVVDELCAKLPDFRRAWDVDGLTVSQFKDYGPVQRFRRQFINGWDTVLTTISERRLKRRGL